MTKTRFILAAGLFSLGLAGPLAGSANAAACDKPAAVVAHTVEVAAAPVTGPVTTPIVHGVVEPAVCAVP